jgi:hypothetical protein
VSILVVQLVPQGILFGADRNITHQWILRDGSKLITAAGHTQRPKVLEWPNREVVLGFVGEAQIDGRSTERWLYAFIGRNLGFADQDAVAETLRAKLDALFQADDFQGPLILHLGGFEQVDGEWIPRIHFIRNTTELKHDGSYVLGDRFDCTEELASPTYFGGKSASEIRNYVSNHVFSFRQGIDLPAFGAIDQALREAMRAIVYGHPAHPRPIPTTLDEWAKHVAFSIHGYGAYYAAFYPPYEQLVGGGADVVTAAWPP